MAQPTFVDFEVWPPFGNGVLLDRTEGGEFAGNHWLMRPGGSVELGGFSVSAGPHPRLVVTVVGHADATARRVPVMLLVNGHEFASFTAVPQVDALIEREFMIPTEHLTWGRDLLTLRVPASADGGFRLYRVLVDEENSLGGSEEVRRELAARGDLFAYRTFEGPPGDEASGRSSELILTVKGEGRAGMARLAWRDRGGQSFAVGFSRDQKSFSGYRVRPGEQSASYVGRVNREVAVDVTRIQQAEDRHRAKFHTQLFRDGRWNDAAAATVQLDAGTEAGPAELSWTDWNGTATSITFDAAGTTFSGIHQPAGGDPTAYRGLSHRAFGVPWPFDAHPVTAALELGGPATGSKNPIGFVRRMLGPAPGGVEHKYVGKLVVSDGGHGYGWIGMDAPDRDGAAHGYIPPGRYPVVMSFTRRMDEIHAQVSFVTVIVRDLPKVTVDAVGSGVFHGGGVMYLHDTTVPDAAFDEMLRVAASEGYQAAHWHSIEYGPSTRATLFGFRNAGGGTLAYLRGPDGEIAGVVGMFPSGYPDDYFEALEFTSNGESPFLSRIL